MQNSNLHTLVASRRIFTTLLTALILLANNSRAQIISNGIDVGATVLNLRLVPINGTGTLLINPGGVLQNNGNVRGETRGLGFGPVGNYFVTNSGVITNSGTTDSHQAIDVGVGQTGTYSLMNAANGVMAINPASIYEVIRSGSGTGSVTNYGLIEGKGSGAVVTFFGSRSTVYNEGTILGGIGFWGGTFPGGTSLTINQVAGEITSNFENSLYTAANTTTVNVSGGKMIKNLYFDGANSVSAVNVSGGELNGNLLYNKAASTNTVTVTGGSLNGNVSFGGSLGTVTFNRADNYNYSNVISGNGALVQAGTNTVTLTGTNTYSRVTTITNGGVLQAGGNQVMSSNSFIRVWNGSFDLNGTTNTIGGLILHNATNTQTGGSLVTRFTSSVPDESLQIGANLGDVAQFDLSGGSLEVQGNLQVGFRGTGTFNQTGGTNILAGKYYFVLGRYAGSTGTYNLSDGVLRQATTGFSIIGEEGTGVLNVSGNGVFSNSDSVRIGLAASGAGTLTLGGNGSSSLPGSFLAPTRQTRPFSILATTPISAVRSAAAVPL